MHAFTALPRAALLGALLGLGAIATAGAAPTFSTDKGTLQCTEAPGHIDCLGIPYAAPPVGELRLRAPAEAEPWRGLRDATRFAPVCLQPKTEYAFAKAGSEDCLYLNVYKPTNTSAQLPVMVWFHGGGFMNGSGNAFNGAALAQTAHAIVITVNYRLGPFGWLALPSLAAEAADGSTGNYGLLDNIAALRWVRRNASVFGGDPGRVTIFGQSAGGEQVLALLASPYATGLFQRAISMSAPAALSMPSVKKSAARRTVLLRELGCTEPATQPACLRRASALALLDAAHENWNMVQQLGLQWTLTVDGAALPDQWQTLFRNGRFNRVPVMVGHTRNESNLFVAIYENDKGSLMTAAEVRDREHKFFGLASALVFLEYPNDRNDTAGPQMAQAMVDSQFAAGEDNNRAALARYVPVWAYQSCDPAAPESHVHARYTTLGCAHDSDLTYLFQWDDFRGETPALNAEQQALAEQLGSYWGNFAANGDPNGPGLPIWPSNNVDTDQVQLLEPASQGGVRPTAPGEYAKTHKLSFWRPMLWLAHMMGK